MLTTKFDRNRIHKRRNEALKSCLPIQNRKATSNVFHKRNKALGCPTTQYIQHFSHQNAIKLLDAQLYNIYSILVTKQLKQILHSDTFYSILH